jgi:hypothetical protein
MAEIMSKKWRGKDGMMFPVEVEVRDGDLIDAHGYEVFSNSHFASKVEAWLNIFQNATAGVKLAGRGVQRAKENLTSAEKQAAKACEEFTAVSEAMRNDPDIVNDLKGIKP